MGYGQTINPLTSLNLADSDFEASCSGMALYSNYQGWEDISQGETFRFVTNPQTLDIWLLESFSDVLEAVENSGWIDFKGEFPCDESRC